MVVMKLKHGGPFSANTNINSQRILIARLLKFYMNEIAFHCYNEYFAKSMSQFLPIRVELKQEAIRNR